MRLRSTSFASVSHRGFSGATAGNFSWVSNVAFRNALVEAANTGLVAGFSSPAGQEQYWLRGARYPNYRSVPGATYTRTGSRAGLDAAVIYPANVPRVAAVNGLRVHGAGTNHARNLGYTGVVAGVIGSGGVIPTENLVFGGGLGLSTEMIGVFNVSGQTVLRMRVFGTPTGTSGSLLFAPVTYPNAPAGTQTTIASLQMQIRLVAGSLASLGVIRMGVDAVTAANVRTLLTIGPDLKATINSTLTRYVVENVTLGGGATTAKYNGLIEFGWTNGVPVDFTIDIGSSQLEQSSFASDYIPNPNTGASSSAGEDDVQVAASALPTSGPILFLADLPSGDFLGTLPRPFAWSVDCFFSSATEVQGRSGGAGTSAIVSGLTPGGPRRIALLYTPGGGTKLSVNGSAVSLGTDVGDAVPTSAVYLGNRPDLSRPLNRGLGVFAAYRATPSDAQLQAMSAL